MAESSATGSIDCKGEPMHDDSKIGAERALVRRGLLARLADKRRVETEEAADDDVVKVEENLAACQSPALKRARSRANLLAKETPNKRFCATSPNPKNDSVTNASTPGEGT